MDLDAAVAENAAWCGLIGRLHGVEYRRGSGLAVADGPPPPFYPGVVTLRAGLTGADVASAARPGTAVKDSYADLDLAPHGCELLFEAQWITHPPAPGDRGEWRVVRTPGELTAWRAAHGSADALPPALLAEPSVAVLGRDQGGVLVAGAVAHLSEQVIGLSNVFGAPDWRCLAAAAADRFGHLPLVGYERSAALAAAEAAGFTALGALRVWLKSG